MKRGDIVTVAIQGDFGKLRTAVVVQSNLFNDTHSSVVVCPMTSTLIDAPSFRIGIQPSAANGLTQSSQMMVDKIITLRRERVGSRIGEIDGGTEVRLNRSLALFLGLA